MDTKKIDYLILGAGSGGLLVAVGLQKLGKNVMVVSKNIGGDCTHFGCVPSKTLLHLAKEYRDAKDDSAKLALRTQALAKVQALVHEFVEEEEHLISQENYIEGSAQFVSKNQIEITTSLGTNLIEFKKKCIIATGSRPVRTRIAGIPDDRILTNEEFFYLTELPQSVTILGGGPIGAEFATACASFGVTTYLVSRTYLPKEPSEISEKSLKALTDLGVNYLAARPKKFENGHLILDDGSTIPETEYYISAIGRIPNTELNLEAAGVAYDKSGISVDRNLTTTNTSIVAIGDCTQNPQFTHLAAHHGKFVLKKIAFPFARRRQRALPRVTFTVPPVASVGETTESEKVRVFRLPFAQLDRGRTNYEEQALGLVYVNVTSGHICGVSMIGGFGEELINLFTLMIDEKISLLVMTDFITPYPTYANILHNLTIEYLNYTLGHWKEYPWGSFKQLLGYLRT